jgi:hypothetical protein
MRIKVKTCTLGVNRNSLENNRSEYLALFVDSVWYKKCSRDDWLFRCLSVHGLLARSWIT